MVIVYGINSSYQSTTRQGLIFLLFATFMAFGAIYSWAYLPDLQRLVVDETSGRRHLETKSLEDLGEGCQKAIQEGQVFTVREKVAEMKRRGRRRLGSITSSQR